jgi:putative tryptophan/tyrosine transport system substrate-binding protein
MGKGTIRIDRREFITLLGGAAAVLPFAARAQRADRVPFVGVLMTGSENDPDSRLRIAGFHQGLEELDLKSGQNIRIEFLWADGRIDQIERHTAEMVRLSPDVIVANSTPIVAALKKLTTSIPVVCALFNDPVGLGFVQSLPRPGGNVTGFTFINPELIGKWMGLLKDVAPATTKAALLFNPKTAAFYFNFLKEIAAAPKSLGIELTPLTVASVGELEAETAKLGDKAGLIIGPDPFNIVNIGRIAALTREARLPAVSVYRQFAVDGGLIAYGPDTSDIFRRSAAYVDRILKGAKPADLPVQEPTKYEFTINLKTAKALGLTVPMVMQMTANEVIE